jgi:hypothetical protein
MMTAKFKPTTDNGTMAQRIALAGLPVSVVGLTLASRLCGETTMTTRVPTLDDLDLAALAPADLHRVRLWAEHELNNIVAPLHLRLQMEMPGTIRIDPTLQAAEQAVARIGALVDGIRRLDDTAWVGCQGKTACGAGTSVL